jgi:hypothetical protein
MSCSMLRANNVSVATSRANKLRLASTAGRIHNPAFGAGLRRVRHWNHANMRDGGLQRGPCARPEARVMSAARAAASAASAQVTTRRPKDAPVISTTSAGRRP